MDEPAANTVKLIFQLALQGKNYAQMIKELYHRKIVTPKIYKQGRKSQKDLPYHSYIWSTTTIKRILSNEQYIGTYVMRKTAVKELGERATKREEKDWIKIPNHHEAIIEKEILSLIHI